MKRPSGRKPSARGRTGTFSNRQRPAGLKDAQKVTMLRKQRKLARKQQAEERKKIEEEKKAKEVSDRQKRVESWDKPRESIEPEIYLEGSQIHRAGWVCLVGRPNVGKSTLLNALLGQKLAATTHKPQTTRKNLLGVLNPPGAQILLLDTPGHHQAKGPLNRYMVSQAEDAIKQADVVAYVVEARGDKQLTPGNERLLERIKASGKPVVVLLNKVDLLKTKEAMAHQIATYASTLGDQLSALVPISAQHRNGLVDAVVAIGRALPEADPILPPEEVTDQSERAIVSEFIREKAMLELQDELPYSVAVTIDSFDDHRPRLVRIFATIHVERSSQKGIVIGKGGRRLKTIGERSRKDIEFLLACKVYLQLMVRVTEAWSANQRLLTDLGYGAQAALEKKESKMSDDIAEVLGELPEEFLEALRAANNEVEVEEDEDEV